MNYNNLFDIAIFLVTVIGLYIGYRYYNREDKKE